MRHKTLNPRPVTILASALAAFALLGGTGPAMAAGEQASSKGPLEYVIDYVVQPYKLGIVDSWFFGINNHGQTTGYIATRNNEGTLVQSAIIYRSGDIQVLTTGPRHIGNGLYGNTTGLAINDRGDVLGVLQYGIFGDWQPTFFAANGSQIPIVTPGLDFTSVWGLNDSRTVLTLGFPTGSTSVSERFGLWQPKGFRPLPVLDVLYPVVLPPDPNDFDSGFQSSTFDQGITGLNNADQFAAGVRLFTYDPMDPNTYDDDVFTEQFLYAYVFNGRNGYRLLQPAASGDEIIPVGIDNKGLVFGWTGDRLALWGLDGSLRLVYPDPGTNLPKFGPGGFPTAQRNERGQVVAITSDGGIVRYDPKSGVWTNITSSIRGLDTGRFVTLQGFNKRGQFTGTVTPPLNRRGYFGFVVSAEPDEDDGD